MQKEGSAASATGNWQMGKFDSATLMSAFDSATTKKDLSKPGREQWVRDDEVVACHLCHQHFNIFTRRKHHCRMCGKVFCHSCSNYKIAIQRSHYEADVEKEHRVCKTCHDNKMKEKDHFRPISLYTVEVTGLDHEEQGGETKTGRKFFFQIDNWSAMLNAAGGDDWIGKKHHVVQRRDGAIVWTGLVAVTRCGPDGMGERAQDKAYGDWQIGDTIQVVGVSRTLMWQEKDVKPLTWQKTNAEEDKEKLDGALYPEMQDRIDMFSGVRVIDVPDLATALERLNPEAPSKSTPSCCSGFLTLFAPKPEPKERSLETQKLVIDEGVCIANCTRPGAKNSEHYLLFREDQKAQGERMYEEYAQHEKERWTKNKMRIKHRQSA